MHGFDPRKQLGSIPVDRQRGVSTLPGLWAGFCLGWLLSGLAFVVGFEFDFHFSKPHNVWVQESIVRFKEGTVLGLWFTAAWFCINWILMTACTYRWRLDWLRASTKLSAAMSAIALLLFLMASAIGAASFYYGALDATKHLSPLPSRYDRQARE